MKPQDYVDLSYPLQSISSIYVSGRAGRVSDGRVYRMITRHFWESYIPDYGIPEMQVLELLLDKQEQVFLYPL